MTARVVVQHGRLRIHRTGVTRWFGAPVDVPFVHVALVRAADPSDVNRWMKGRLVGIQIPGLVTSGTFWQDGQMAWWDVRQGTEAIVITFRDERLGKAIVEVADPTTVMRTLGQALTALPGAIGR